MQLLQQVQVLVHQVDPKGPIVAYQSAFQGAYQSDKNTSKYMV